ncbi:glycine zipper family protein [Humitalea sp. 24SJ18S-53]|uniref:glycine zipper family protein n=1 Tax=Humitalea sp. 24SJ18S-53 TaxID=3422307 RepID=UPI003D66A223
MRKTLLIPAALALMLGACADMTQQQRTVATGTAIGALGGAAIGSFSGNAGMGALIGAGAGAAGGFLVDQSQRNR